MIIKPVNFFKLILVVIACLLSYSAFSDDLDQKIQSVVDRDRLKYGLPALSVSVLLSGELLPRNYVSGYYTLNEKNKISPKTLFQIGSITKTFTASIILHFHEHVFHAIFRCDAINAS
jgi:CubicO group peptidase (beta-lactamase class C family)